LPLMMQKNFYSNAVNKILVCFCLLLVFHSASFADQSKSNYYEGLDAYQQKDYKGAAEHFESQLKKTPNNQSALKWLKKSQQMAKRANTPQTEPAYLPSEKAINEFEKGIVFYRQSQFSDALKSFGKYASRFPDHVPTRQWITLVKSQVPAEGTAQFAIEQIPTLPPLAAAPLKVLSQEISLLQKEKGRLAQELKKVRKNLETRNGQIAQSVSQQKQLLTQADEVKAIHEKLTNEIDNLRQVIKEKESETGEARNQVIELKKLNAQLQQSNAKLDNSLKNQSMLRKQVSASQTNRGKFDKELKSKTLALNQAQAKIVEIEKALQGKEAILNDKIKKLDDLQAKQAQTQTIQDKLRKEIETSKMIQKTITKELETRSRDLETKSKELENKSLALSEAQKRVLETEKALKSKDTVLQDKVKSLNDLTAKQKEIIKSQASLRNEVETFKDNQGKLTKQLDSKSKELENKSLALSEAQKRVLETEKALKSKDTVLQDKVKSLNDLTAKQKEIIKSQASLRNEVETFKDNQGKLTKQLDSKSKELQNTSLSLTQAQERIQEIEKALRDKDAVLQDKVKTLNGFVTQQQEASKTQDSLRKELEVTQANRDKLVDILEANAIAIDKKDSELLELGKDIEALRKQTDSSKTQISSSVKRYEIAKETKHILERRLDQMTFQLGKVDTNLEKTQKSMKELLEKHNEVLVSQDQLQKQLTKALKLKEEITFKYDVADKELITLKEKYTEADKTKAMLTETQKALAQVMANFQNAENSRLESNQRLADAQLDNLAMMEDIKALQQKGGELARLTQTQQVQLNKSTENLNRVQNEAQGMTAQLIRDLSQLHQIKDTLSKANQSLMTDRLRLRKQTETLHQELFQTQLILNRDLTKTRAELEKTKENFSSYKSDSKMRLLAMEEELFETRKRLEKEMQVSGLSKVQLAQMEKTLLKVQSDFEEKNRVLGKLSRKHQMLQITNKKIEEDVQKIGEEKLRFQTETLKLNDVQKQLKSDLASNQAKIANMEQQNAEFAKETLQLKHVYLQTVQEAQKTKQGMNDLLKGLTLSQKENSQLTEALKQKDAKNTENVTTSQKKSNALSIALKQEKAKNAAFVNKIRQLEAWEDKALQQINTLRTRLKQTLPQVKKMRRIMNGLNNKLIAQHQFDDRVQQRHYSDWSPSEYRADERAFYNGRRPQEERRINLW
jgi:chromosome segregation ATPase